MCARYKNYSFSFVLNQIYAEKNSKYIYSIQNNIFYNKLEKKSDTANYIVEYNKKKHNSFVLKNKTFKLVRKNSYINNHNIFGYKKYHYSFVLNNLFFNKSQKYTNIANQMIHFYRREYYLDYKYDNLFLHRNKYKIRNTIADNIFIDKIKIPIFIKNNFNPIYKSLKDLSFNMNNHMFIFRKAYDIFIYKNVI